MPQVNRQELGGLLRVSLPTVDALLRRYPDLPVVEQGGLGKQWRFDAEAVLEFLQEKRAAEDEAGAEREQLLAQLTLPIGEPRDETGKPLTLREQREAAQLRKLLREEKIASGFLVSTVEMRPKLEKLFRQFALMQAGVLTAIQREHNIPEPVMAAMRAKFDNARTAFVRDARPILAAPDDDEGGLFAAAE